MFRLAEEQAIGETARKSLREALRVSVSESNARLRKKRRVVLFFRCGGCEGGEKRQHRILPSFSNSEAEQNYNSQKKQQAEKHDTMFMVLNCPLCLSFIFCRVLFSRKIGKIQEIILCLVKCGMKIMHREHYNL